MGMPRAFWICWKTREIIATRRYCGSLFDENSGHLHPLKYALGLAKAAALADVKIYETPRRRVLAVKTAVSE